MKKIVLTFCLTLVFSSLLAYDIPKFTNYVNDYANVLTEQEEVQLNKILKNYQDTTSTQIAFLIIPNFDDRKEGPLFDYSVTIFESWKIGQKNKNNGVLFVIVKNLTSKNAPGLRIATGYGVEGALPDATCKKIIEDIRPMINEGKYYQGINIAISSMAHEIKGEFKSEGKGSIELDGMTILIIIVIVVILLIIFAVRAGGSSSGSGSDSGGFFFIGSSSDSGSYGDSGGDFGGGGGGDCGGGGAGD